MAIRDLRFYDEQEKCFAPIDDQEFIRHLSAIVEEQKDNPIRELSSMISDALRRSNPSLPSYFTIFN